MTIIETLASADLVIAVGSVDGVLTAAAVKRLSGRPDLEVVFTQPFQVNQLPVGSWSGRRVVLVDLAVNNREPAMTKAFISRVFAPGMNVLLAVIDEHDAEAWAEVFSNHASATGDWLPQWMAVAPQSQGAEGGPDSSGEVLRRALVAEDVVIDDHTAALLAAADSADHGDFSLPLAGVVNSAVKSAIGDNRRRVHLVDLLAAGPEVDDQVRAWVDEYEEMTANQAELLTNAVVDLGDGIVRVDTDGRRVDSTSLLFALYKRGRVAVLAGTSSFNKAAGRAVPVVSIATGDRALDVLAAIKAAGVSAGGFAQKANVDPADEERAIAAFRAALTA